MKIEERRAAVWTIAGYAAVIAILLLVFPREHMGFIIVGYGLVMAVTLLRIPFQVQRDEAFRQRWEYGREPGFWRGTLKASGRSSTLLLIGIAVVAVGSYFSGSGNMMDWLMDQSPGTFSLVLFIFLAASFLIGAAVYAGEKQKYARLNEAKNRR
ncbi:hypothetical protein QWJ34_11345 [Saccharibacillus sp. CPCC 101409]|uniref:hypothetical protein n=1 Tax=Saccharibacillus sp. CPCC 101409 TaxID=3058041 RepID=UPI00267224F3|nr:hypothetical protein [Saccharibacillus sp. CPCC 101409]MDO3410358.1 hypothetical protein [Saccharibacillus sp. CPCC 101409]